MPKVAKTEHTPFERFAQATRHIFKVSVDKTELRRRKEREGAEDDHKGHATRFRHRLTLGALVAALVFILLACSPGDPTMPDLSGLHKDEATEALQSEGIEDWTVEWHEGTKPMVVVNQEPEAGAPVTDDSEVRITLSGE